MSPHETKYLNACKTNGIIIDTNLLIIYLVGLYDPKLIDEKTFIYLQRVLAYTGAKIIITPHIITEISNMTITKKVVKDPGFEVYISKLIGIFENAGEELVEMARLISNPKLLAAFGFTDLSIVEAAKTLQCGVMTADAKLATHLLNNKCYAQNIEYLIPVPT